MHLRWKLVFPMLLSSAALGAERPWQQITVPGMAEAAAAFRTPPPEYGLTMWWGWDGPITEEVIARDLDGFKARGVAAVTIEPGYSMDNAPYLSPGWFERETGRIRQRRRPAPRSTISSEERKP